MRCSGYFTMAKAVSRFCPNHVPHVDSALWPRTTVVFGFPNPMPHLQLDQRKAETPNGSPHRTYQKIARGNYYLVSICTVSD